MAVKIQYPGAGNALLSDFTQLSRVARLFSALMPGLEVRPLLDELRATHQQIREQIARHLLERPVGDRSREVIESAFALRRLHAGLHLFFKFIA